jgi:hypothetical protein
MKDDSGMFEVELGPLQIKGGFGNIDNIVVDLDEGDEKES